MYILKKCHARYIRIHILIFNYSYQTIASRYKAYKFDYSYYERLCITFRKFRYRFSCEYSNFC